MALDNLLYNKKALGKGGEEILIRKIRTMIPEADSLLDLAFEGGIDCYGKPREDFRVTPIGKILRKYWIDETPQILDVITGKLNLIGIRAKSKNDWKQYPNSYKNRALQLKPGLINVNYCASKKDILKKGPQREFQRPIAHDRLYLSKRKKSPLKTDSKYLIKFLYNVFMGVRSK